MESVNLMTAMPGINTDVRQGIAVQGNDGGEGNFGSILGGMMNGGNAPSADVTDAAAVTAETAQAEGMTAVMSDASRNALTNLIAVYYKAAENGTDSEGIMAQWSELLENLDGGVISDLAGFSAELETALFGGSRYDDGEEKSAADIFSGMLDSIADDDDVKDKELTAALAIAGQSGFSFADLVNAFSPSVQTEEYFVTEAVGAAENAGTDSTAALNDPSAMLKSAAETVKNADDSMAEGFSDLLSEAVKEHLPERTEIVTEVKTEVSTENTGAVLAKSDTAETLAANGRIVRREVDGSDNDEMPRIMPENTDTAEKPAALDQPLTAAEDAMPQENTAAADTEISDISAVKVTEQEVTDEEKPADERIAAAAAVQTDTAGSVRTVYTASADSTDDAEQTGRSVNIQTAEQILARLDESPETGEKRLTIRLDPHSLGEIEVNIVKSENGAVTVTLAAHNESTARLLGERSSELVQMLSQRNESEVSVNVVDPTSAGQYLEFDMNGGMYGHGGERASGGRRSGARFSLDDDEEEEISGVSAVSSEQTTPREAKLWTTA